MPLHEHPIFRTKKCGGMWFEKIERRKNTSQHTHRPTWGKGDDTMAKGFIVTITDLDGNNPVVITPQPKEFTTGSTGYYNSFKLSVGGEYLQCALQCTVVNSKHDPDAAERAERAKAAKAAKQVVRELQKGKLTPEELAVLAKMRSK